MCIRDRVRTAYGAVLGAGSILRSDVVTENSLTVVGGMQSLSAPFEAENYRAVSYTHLDVYKRQPP